MNFRTVVSLMLFSAVGSTATVSASVELTSNSENLSKESLFSSYSKENFVNSVELKNLSSMSLENNSMGSNENEISTLSDCSNNSAELKSALLTQFLKDAKISETQEKAFIESNKFLKKCNGNHLALAAFNKISSLRCKDGVPSCPTKFEAILDSGVEEGDLL